MSYSSLQKNAKVIQDLPFLQALECNKTSLNIYSFIYYFFICFWCLEHPIFFSVKFLLPWCFTQYFLSPFPLLMAT